jgi:hypothetical protein
MPAALDEPIMASINHWSGLESVPDAWALGEKMLLKYVPSPIIGKYVVFSLVFASLNL